VEEEIVEPNMKRSSVVFTTLLVCDYSKSLGNELSE